MAHLSAASSLVVLVLGACAISSSLTLAEAAAFRGRIPDLAAVQGASPELEKALLSEIEDVLGSEHRRATEGRLSRIEKVLRPIFAALPKNELGRLGHTAVRYAVHRLFVQRHGWFVQGLDPAGDAWNATTAPAAAILQDRLPAFVQGLFERRVGGHGLTLHELAVMAATLENLVHGEAMDRLGHTYRALERSQKDPLSVEESHSVIDAYMAIYILGFNYSAMSPIEVREQQENITEIYPSWPETQKFAREVQAIAVPSAREELTFENVASVVEEIGERYGRWQDTECRTLKNSLVALEHHNTGRVRLADFYGSAINHGNWQFSESVEYLRNLGALDESDPQNLRVIIPNYVNSPTNCVASSNYYSVCCIDECEDILGHLEEKLSAPDATPAEIAPLVAALPSATLPANRSLPESLLRRLDEVAQYHQGRVPLHGRLFAQWLHHAYPRECPYPHVAGTTSPQQAEAWMEQTGKDVAASEEEMRRYVEAAQLQAGGASPGAMLWTMEEELKVSRPAMQVRPRPAMAAFRGACKVAAVATVLLALGQLLGSSLRRNPEELLPKYHSKYV